MPVKLKCGSTFSLISPISLLRLPLRISLSLAMSSTTSRVTVFTSTSGGVSCAWAAAKTSAATRPRPVLVMGIITWNGINMRRAREVDACARFFRLFVLPRLARRTPVVNQVPAPLQIRVALEHVPVERGFLQDPAGIEQIGARAGDAQDDERILQPV